MWWRFRKVAAFARLCVFGGLCVDMWRLVHRWWFLLFWLSFDCFWRMVHWNNRQRHSKPLVYQSSQVYQDCTNSAPIVKNSQKQWKHSQNSTKMTIGVPVVTCLPRLYQPCTNSLPKTVKRQSKQQKWPLVYQSSQVYQVCTNKCTNRQQEISYRK